MKKETKRNTKALLLNTIVVLLSTVIAYAGNSINKPTEYIDHKTTISINVNVKEEIQSINLN